MPRTILSFLLFFVVVSAFSQSSTENHTISDNQVFMESVVANTDYAVGCMNKVSGNWEFVKEEDLKSVNARQKKAIFRGIDLALLSQQMFNYVVKNGEQCYTYLVKRDDEIWNIAIYGCE